MRNEKILYLIRALSGSISKNFSSSISRSIIGEYRAAVRNSVAEYKPSWKSEYKRANAHDPWRRSLVTKHWLNFLLTGVIGFFLKTLTSADLRQLPTASESGVTKAPKPLSCLLAANNSHTIREWRTPRLHQGIQTEFDWLRISIAQGAEVDISGSLIVGCSDD